jgi:hypothetical protein
MAGWGYAQMMLVFQDPCVLGGGEEGTGESEGQSLAV